MKIYLLLVFFLFLSQAEMSGQAVGTIDAEQLVLLTHQSNDTTYVINFWATWCSPCVKEIAYFEQLHRDQSHEKLKVILVSLDFMNQLERRVVPFLEDKEISAEVKIMTDTDYNAWIDRVDPSWSGAIPATLIYRGDRRVFLEKELAYHELVEQIHQIQR